MNSIRAKFKVEQITEFEWGGKEAQLRAVCVGNGESQENNSFAEATPSGEMTITIDKEAVAKDFLEVGEEYYLDFTKA